MDFDDLGFPGSEDEYDDPDDGVDTEALERWLIENHSLWKLGMDLANRARQYRREYKHLPFNQLGWFSPN